MPRDTFCNWVGVVAETSVSPIALWHMIDAVAAADFQLTDQPNRICGFVTSASTRVARRPAVDYCSKV